MNGPGPIYDPNEVDKLIHTYLEHGDLLGWGQAVSSEQEEDCKQEEHGDE